MRVALDRQTLSLTPGEAETLTVTLSNPSAVPLSVQLSVGGVPPHWVSVPRGAVQLPPGGQANGRLRVLVPATEDVQSGVHIAAVRASTTVQPPLVAETLARWQVRGARRLRLTLDPPTRRTRRSASYQIQLENQSEQPTEVTFSAFERSRELRFRFSPPSVTALPGTTADVKLEVASTPRLLGRRAQQRRFSITATGSGGAAPPVNGEFSQAPLLPFWLPLLALVLLAICVLVAYAAAAQLDGDSNEQPAAGVSATTTTPPETPTLVVPGIAAPRPSPTIPLPTATATPTPLPTATAVPATATIASAPVSLIAFAGTRGSSTDPGTLEIYVMDGNGENRRLLITGAEDDWLPNWSPNGARIAWIAKRDGNDELYVADSDGQAARRLTDDAADDRFPTWSPNSRRIVVARGPATNEDLFVIDADTGESLRLTENNDYDGYAAWSPDGLQLAWTSGVTGNSEIFVMNADGSNVRQLTESSANDYNPSWSPDGQRIVFVSDRNGSFDLFSMRADGSDTRRLTTESSDELTPVFSPDGSTIAFLRVTDAGSQLAVIPTGGGTARTLADGLFSADADISWSPDSTQLAFLRGAELAIDIWTVTVSDRREQRLTANSVFDGNISWALVVEN